MSLRLEVKEEIEKEELENLRESSKQVEKFKGLYYDKVKELIKICCCLEKNELQFGFNFYKKVYNDLLVYLEGSEKLNHDERDVVFNYVELKLKNEGFIIDVSNAYLEHIFFSDDSDGGSRHVGYLNVKFFTISNILNSNTYKKLSADNIEKIAFTKLILSRKDNIMNEFSWISGIIKKDIKNNEKTVCVTEWETWSNLGFQRGLFSTEGSKIEDFLVYLYFLEMEFIKIKVTPIYKRKIRNYNGMIYWEGLTMLKDIILFKRINILNLKFEILT